MIKNIFTLLLLASSALAQTSPTTINADKIRNVKAPTNFVINPDADKNLSSLTSGFTLAFTRDTATPLEGPGSFLGTVTGTDCLVNGNCTVGNRFTLKARPSSVTNRACTLSANYKVTSSTGTTQAQLVFRKSGVDVYTATRTLNGNEQGFFDADFPCDSADEVAVGAVTTSAITALFDNVSFGISANVGTNAIVTPVQSYTPLFNGGIPSNGTASGKYWRIADRLYLTGAIKFTGTPASFTTSFVSLPSGLVIDTAKLPNSDPDGMVLGTTTSLDTSVALFPGDVRYNNTSTIELTAFRSVSGTNPVTIGVFYINNTFPVAFGNTDAITWQTNGIPIVGWDAFVPAVTLNGAFNPYGSYVWTPDSVCPMGSIYADGTNGTVDMRAAFQRGDGAQTVSSILHTAGALAGVFNDQVQGHRHSIGSGNASATTSGNPYAGNTATATSSDPITDGTNGTPRTGNETFPMHRVGKFCKVIASSIAPRVAMAVITGNTTGPEKLFRAVVSATCSASPCTIANQSGGISSVTRSATGAYGINFAAGEVSYSPSCSITISAGSDPAAPNITGRTTTQITFLVRDRTGTPLDSGFDILCMGPK